MRPCVYQILFLYLYVTTNFGPSEKLLFGEAENYDYTSLVQFDKQQQQVCICFASVGWLPMLSGGAAPCANLPLLSFTV